MYDQRRLDAIEARHDHDYPTDEELARGTLKDRRRALVRKMNAIRFEKLYTRKKIIGAKGFGDGC